MGQHVVTGTYSTSRVDGLKCSFQSGFKNVSQLTCLVPRLQYRLCHDQRKDNLFYNKGILVISTATQIHKKNGIDVGTDGFVTCKLCLHRQKRPNK